MSAQPRNLQAIRNAAARALQGIEPARELTDAQDRALLLSSRTRASRDLPPYYLVYFLLVDLLEYPDLGEWEKVAWRVPVRYRGRLYAIEHRKFGIAVVSPTLDAKATTNAPPTVQAETDAVAIVRAITKAVAAAKPYFEWRAERAVADSRLNVVNNANWLFERFRYFRERFRELDAEAQRRNDERSVTRRRSQGGTLVTTHRPARRLARHAKWNAQACIDAFFSFTEHVFIHIAILRAKATTGDAVAELAASDWRTKFKAAIDVDDATAKRHYDRLGDLRAQIRNFMAHGAFGKRGEAFLFHSGAGAVPVIFTGESRHRYTLYGEPTFDEAAAIADIDAFIDFLWSGERAPAQLHIEGGLQAILTYAQDGTYTKMMRSVARMADFVEAQVERAERAADMDW